MRAVLFVVVTVSLTGTSAADPLGRLFVTAEERAALDRMQREDAPSAAPPRRHRAEVAVNGIVTGTERDYVWVNETLVEPNEARAGPSGASRSVLVETRSRTAVVLKPGQAWSEVSHEVLESYERVASAVPEEDR